MQEMASEEAIRFVKIPTRTLCYASGLGIPSMPVRDTDLEYDISSEICILAQGSAAHKVLGIYPQVLALNLSPSELTPGER